VGIKVSSLNWINVKEALPVSKMIVFGYYELWGNLRPSEDEFSRHVVVCFYDWEKNQWYDAENTQTVLIVSHWAIIPNIPSSDEDQRVNIGRV